MSMTNARKSTGEMQLPDYEIQHNREPYYKTLEFHAHDFLELYLFLEGSVTYYIEDQVYELCPGDLLLIPPGKMHRPVIANENMVYERMVLWVDLEYLAQLDGADTVLRQGLQTVGEKGYCVRFRGERLLFLMRLLQEAQRMRREKRDDVFSAGAVRLALLQAFEEYSRMKNRVQPETDVIPQVIRYITEHFDQPLSLEGLAARFYISRSYLYRRFKAYTNTSVYAYLMALRITHARGMLRQGMPAEAVSQACGFTEYSTFYRAFRGQTGLSPQQFRMKNES